MKNDKQNTTERTDRPGISRRQALSGMVVGTAMIAPNNVLGRAKYKAPSEKINLGVIGFGPRCTYLMNAMLRLPEARCVAIADVQKSRREAGKALVD